VVRKSPLRKWVLGTGRIQKEKADTCLYSKDQHAWKRGRARAKLSPKDHRTGFHLYSRSSVKCGVIEEVEAKDCMMRFVFGVEAEFRRLSGRDGLEEESQRD